MNLFKLATASAFCALSALACAQSDPLTLGYSKVWIGQYSSLPATPIRVDMENIGPGELVELIARAPSGNIETVTPVEMPRGAEKTVEMYLPSVPYMSPSLVVKRGLLESSIPIQIGFPEMGQVLRIALISDHLGDLTMLRRPDSAGKYNQQDYRRLNFEDLAAKPGESPSRSIGYWGIDVLLLGEGCERLTDVEVSAIKAATLQGLTLVFVGGTVRPIFADPRWRDMLPVAGIGSSTVRSLDPLASKLGQTAGFAVPMLELTPDPAVKSVPTVNPVAVGRSFGKGAVIVLAFDPFSQAMKKWSGRHTMFRWLASDLEVNERFVPDPPGPENLGTGSERIGVFKIELPPAGRIALLLFGYLVVVAPINFLVLRKLRRGELAWITAPLLALGCAAILFGFASRLYGADASSATVAMVYGSTGSDELVAQVTQQLYFPSGGSVDLKLRGVEYVTPTSEEHGMLVSATTSQFVDVGQVVAPQYQVSNLSFREFGLVQRLPLPGPLATAVLKRDGVVEVTVTNPFDAPLTDTSVTSDRKPVQFDTIAPGETLTREVPIVSSDALRLQTSCQLKGLGAQFGHDVSGYPIYISYTVAVRKP